MTLQDSILMQISQNKTSSNDIFTRVRPNYSSISSAKAAMSRALKNLIAFGEIKKEGDFYSLTDKGKQIVDSKLKNKILININDQLKKSDKFLSVQNIDEIIKNLQTFIERSKVDPTLLKIGKTSSSFYISNLDDLKLQIDSRISHLVYLKEVLTKQIEVLRELNFEDLFVINFDNRSFDTIKKLGVESSLKEIIIECNAIDKTTIDLFIDHPKFIKKGEFAFILQISDVDLLKEVLLKNLEMILQTNIKLYISELVIKLQQGKLYFSGPSYLITKIKKESNALSGNNTSSNTTSSSSNTKLLSTDKVNLDNENDNDNDI
ncbi:MAG: hypothetical protein V1824_03990 [archaeon]